MNLKINLGSYITNGYKNGQNRVQLISNQRVCTIEEVDKYFSDVIDGYVKQEKTNTIKEIITNVKDKLWQIVKRK